MSHWVVDSEWQTEKAVEQEKEQLDGSLAVAFEVQALMACFQRIQRQSMDCYLLQSLVLEVVQLPLHWLLSVPMFSRKRKRGKIRLIDRIYTLSYMYTHCGLQSSTCNISIRLQKANPRDSVYTYICNVLLDAYVVNQRFAWVLSTITLTCPLHVLFDEP